MGKVMSSRALLGLLHGRPDIPSHRKKMRTKHSGHLESIFQAMAGVFSQTGSVGHSAMGTMSPKTPGCMSPQHAATVVLNLEAKSKRSPGTRPSYRAGKLPVLPQGEARTEIRG